VTCPYRPPQQQLLSIVLVLFGCSCAARCVRACVRVGPDHCCCCCCVLCCVGTYTAEPLPGDDGAIRFREMTYAEFLTSMATLVK
jgi:hypothetical protein